MMEEGEVSMIKRNKERIKKDLRTKRVVQRLSEMHKEHATDPEVLRRSCVGDFDPDHPRSAQLIRIMGAFGRLCRPAGETR